MAEGDRLITVPDLAPEAPPPSILGRGPARAALAGLGATLLMLYPMLRHDYLPLVDVPNHIARFAVMARPEGPLGAYYTVSSSLLTPNSATDLLWQATGMGGDPAAFARITMIVYAANFILAVMVLGRVATGRWSVWPTVAGMLVYNGSFLWGFQNYVFTVPFALHALSLWLVMERRAAALRAAVFLPVAALIFVMHLLAFGALAVAVFGREVQRLLAGGPGWGRRFGAAAVSGIPFMLPLLWYAYDAASGPPGVLGTQTKFGDGFGRLRAVLSLQWEVPLAGEASALFLSGILAILLLGACLLTLLRRSGPRLRLASPLRGPIVALLVLAAFTPSWLNGVALVHIRFPFVALAVLIAGSHWIDLRPRQGAVLAVLFAALFAHKSVEFQRLWAKHDAEIRDLRVVLDEIPPGSRLLSLRAPGQEMMRRLWHSPGYATAYHDVFIPTFFQGTHAVTLKKEWRDHAGFAYRPIEARRLFGLDAGSMDVPAAHLANNYWAGWERKFTHVLFMDPMPVPDTAAERLREIRAEGRFRLLEVRASGS